MSCIIFVKSKAFQPKNFVYICEFLYKNQFFHCFCKIFCEKIVIFVNLFALPFFSSHTISGWISDFFR